MHRTALAALVLALVGAGSLSSQVVSWQVVGGVGGITGQSIAHRPVFVGAFGREFVASSTFGFGAELTMGSLPTGDFVCIQAACDLRELAKFGALSITGVISPPAGIVTPYLRGRIGAWVGGDAGTTSDQSSREMGPAIAGELGIRLGQFAPAVRLDQLNGVRRGTLHILSIVVRVNF